MSRPRRAVVAALVPAIMLAACGGSERDAPARSPTPNPGLSATSASSPSASPSPAETVPPVPSERVSFGSATGAHLVGRLFGDGRRRGVVLAHQIDDDQSDWFDFARALASRGYTVLTFNFEGVCGGGGCSRGYAPSDEAWNDAVAAVRFLEERDVRQIALVGASFGGEVCIAAAAHLGSRIAGVVTLSASLGLAAIGPGAARRYASRVTVPKLFVAGEYDTSFADSARAFDRVAPEPKRLVLLPYGQHGVDLLKWEPGPRTRALVTSFLDRVTH